MERSRLEEKLEKCINRIYDAEEDSLANKSWVFSSNDEHIDSVMALRIVLAIEQEFAVTIDDEEIRPEHFKSLEALADLVQKKLSA
ncbi:MAG: hypothetical protein GEU77_06120 [Deltaproteobacteria bacterium]|nr:hypothetical protein [Deltaproteobacteria bacterium]